MRETELCSTEEGRCGWLPEGKGEGPEVEEGCGE